MECRARSGAPQARGGSEGWTLLEILIVVAVLAVLAVIGVTLYRSGVNSSRIAKAVAEIRAMEMDIETFVEMYGECPVALIDVGHGNRLDPWNHPYRYLNLATAEKGKMRKDKNLVPINSDYDLYSMGPDGVSVAPLTASTSRDDIVRANDGEFVGIATDY